MSEVKTPPVSATHLPEKADFHEGGRGLVPGGFRCDTPDSDGEQAFWYCCPCGCGRIAPLNVGNGFKPAVGPSWKWNGSTERPTLEPSVNHVGHWHGWLTDGVWTSC